jgi:tRNA (cmo5U34)-methyltransferase
MSGFEWDPETYLALMAEEIPDYPRLQAEVVAAATTGAPRSILDLGVGSELTARRVLEAIPEARLFGVDASSEMLSAAEANFDSKLTELRLGRLEDPLPNGPFDLVMSTLAIHHLDGTGKADLFARIAGVLNPGGRFVLGDLVVTADPADMVTPIDWVEDVPSSLDEQLSWLVEVGLTTRVHWQFKDLAVVIAEKRTS